MLKKRTITLTYGGEEIPEQQVVFLKRQLKSFGLDDTQLEIHQGFAYLAQVQNNRTDEQTEQLNLVLTSKEAELNRLQAKLDSTQNFRKLALQVYNELKVQYPDLATAVISPADVIINAQNLQPTLVVVLTFTRNKSTAEKKKIESWLKVRFQQENVLVIFNK